MGLIYKLGPLISGLHLLNFADAGVAKLQIRADHSQLASSSVCHYDGWYPYPNCLHALFMLNLLLGQHNGAESMNCHTLHSLAIALISGYNTEGLIYFSKYFFKKNHLYIILVNLSAWFWSDMTNTIPTFQTLWMRILPAAFECIQIFLVRVLEIYRWNCVASEHVPCTVWLLPIRVLSWCPSM